MKRIFMCSLVILSLLYQTAFSYPTINTEDSKSQEFDPPIIGRPIEKKYFAGDGSDIIQCPVTRGFRVPVKAVSYALFFESNNTRILGIGEIPAYTEEFSTTASFKNLSIKKQDNDVTILCKGFYQTDDSVTFHNTTYPIILCFQENCDKDHEESTDVLLPLLMVAFGVTLSLLIAKCLVVFQKKRESQIINEFKPSESIPKSPILLPDMKPGCSAEASST